MPPPPVRQWQVSSPHLLLLAHFRAPLRVVDLGPADWQSVLAEPLPQAVERFVRDGYLVPAADPDTLICSAEGRVVPEKFLAEEAYLRRAAERFSLEWIRERHFAEAVAIVKTYQLSQVFPRPVDPQAVTWCQEIVSGRPKILAALDPAPLAQLQTAAVMAYLWGDRDPGHWLALRSQAGIPNVLVVPAEVAGLRLDAATAALMLLYYLCNHKVREHYRHTARAGSFRVTAAAGACPACLAFGSLRLTLAEVPELPYEHCTHARGCRCYLTLASEATLGPARTADAV
jgi:hypothetical protein